MRAALLAALLAARPAPAIPPPPVDSGYEKSADTIATLSPFFGIWEGTQDVPGLYGTEHITHRRTLAHIGMAVSFVVDQDQPPTFMAITASPRGELSLHRIGPSRFTPGEMESVPLERPTPLTLRWTMATADIRAAAFS